VRARGRLWLGVLLALLLLGGSPPLRAAPSIDPVRSTPEPGQRSSSGVKVWLPLVKSVQTRASIQFTRVPDWGTFDDLEGQVHGVPSSEYAVAVYIYGSGWWTKPYWGQPLTPLRTDGSWTCDITTGGSDEQASRIAAFVIPKGDDPPLGSGEPTLPAELYGRAVAFAMVDREPVRRQIEFSGYTWWVKASGTPVGPGPNVFSDRAEDVWMDAEGRLHLRIVEREGRWTCAEVVTTDPLGYGTYVWRLARPVDPLDRNAVLGLFTWDDGAPEHNYREIDVEFSRWGLADNQAGQYVVQPYTRSGNMLRFDAEWREDHSTHGFDWQADRVFFQSLTGHRAFPGPVEHEIVSWTYTGDDVPPEGRGNARINLWLVDGKPPSDGKTVEMIVEAFEYVPHTGAGQ
jgi:hypothetical protein